MSSCAENVPHPCICSQHLTSLRMSHATFLLCYNHLAQDKCNGNSFSLHRHVEEASGEEENSPFHDLHGQHALFTGLVCMQKEHCRRILSTFSPIVQSFGALFMHPASLILHSSPSPRIHSKEVTHFAISEILIYLASRSFFFISFHHWLHCALDELIHHANYNARPREI